MQICVVGLGYVGLPLAMELSQYFCTIGYDTSGTRINELKCFNDRNGDYSHVEMQTAIDRGLRITNSAAECVSSNFYIVTVPTPISADREPDMSYLVTASYVVGKQLSLGDIVVFESTVYPGATEEVCLPALEKASGLKAGQDFHIGYSPERINPGDKSNHLANIVKVISAQNDETLSVMKRVYEKVVSAGLHETSSIREAEMSKVVENSQRDVNIAFMNEISIICNKLNIDTNNVLDAARTKWNFLNFKPGLVGGHCIGIDPYYLINKASTVNAEAKLLSSAREINEGMVSFAFENIMSCINEKIHNISDAKIAIWGVTFKPNVPDVRNSKAIEIIHNIIIENKFSYIDIIDPLYVQDATVPFPVSPKPSTSFYDVNLIITCHDIFKEKHEYTDVLDREGSILIDITSQYRRNSYFSF